MWKATLCLGLGVAPQWSIENTETLGLPSRIYIPLKNRVHVKSLIMTQELKKKTRYEGNTTINCQAVLFVFNVTDPETPESPGG